MHHYAYAAALAFVGMCAAIAYAAVNAPPTPPKKDAQIICMEQRGKWVGSGWGGGLSTCEFPAASTASK